MFNHGLLMQVGVKECTSALFSDKFVLIVISLSSAEQSHLHDCKYLKFNTSRVILQYLAA